ncbi:hypothetical protein DFJ77DRAFT_481332 [Powellomyces hirtus]|nr:hypothetical protein DFJ77DRAFT_481332 [Powellomyces hirtus]
MKFITMALLLAASSILASPTFIATPDDTNQPCTSSADCWFACININFAGITKRCVNGFLGAQCTSNDHCRGDTICLKKNPRFRQPYTCQPLENATEFVRSVDWPSA